MVKSGKSCTFTLDYLADGVDMTQFLGEYECKIDSKGRIMLPVGLRKQVSPEAQERFVVNRGFAQCLALYPYEDWQRISAEVNQLTFSNKKNRDLAPYFFRGANELFRY